MQVQFMTFSARMNERVVMSTDEVANENAAMSKALCNPHICGFATPDGIYHPAVNNYRHDDFHIFGG
jgi:hypothetical protein